MGKAAAHTLTPKHASPPMVSTSHWVPGSLIIRELEALTGQSCPVTFRRLIDLAASNRVPLDRKDERWGVARCRLPEVAAALGMAAGCSAPRVGTTRRSSADLIPALG